MAHKTLIDGTAYEISGGKALVDGTAYNIKGGKTLVDGTGYEIGFTALWSKYSCTITEGYYTRIYPNGTGNDFFPNSYGYARIYYTSAPFTSKYGFSNNKIITNIALYSDDTDDEIKSKVEGLYYYVGTTYAEKIISIYNIESDNYGYVIHFTYEAERAQWVPETYSKGSKSYGTIKAPAGELPEDGTLIEGSADEGYCVLKIGSTYYYYELEA